MKNKLDHFLVFLKEHQKFKFTQVADEQGEYHLGIEFKKGKSDFNRINRKKIDVIYYFQDIFVEYDENAFIKTEHEIIELDELRKNFYEKTFEGKSYWWHKNVAIEKDLDDYLVKPQLSFFHHEYISNIILSQKKAVDEILESYAKISSSFRSKSNQQKTKIKLSVGELALLFRLLKEEGLFEYKYETEIYRLIANTFSTKIQENISEASIKNKFLSPDNTSIKNIHILLTNLKTKLKNIN
ncbi:hypothetical protein SAMN05444285_12368 [Draconibacterium orientale]|uniref:RteC protein n=1 Tax=Draconibacterium orientale TaxID=1168034 RepID=X5DGP5_9BACT|nr:hypothetical protein [Draconibacterium orientale]AHW62148.1 hypothetical protein FH5T_16150 [Draconibacterium orientale]SET79149.1 hypothetical protein SAMN05444285_12368 [Draconibacterium orientale]